MQQIAGKKKFIYASIFHFLLGTQNIFAGNETSGVRPNCVDDPSTCAGITNSAPSTFAINEPSGVRPNCVDDPSTCAGIANSSPSAAAEIPCQGGPQECGAVIGAQEEMLKNCTPGDGEETQECDDGSYQLDSSIIEDITRQLPGNGQ